VYPLLAPTDDDAANSSSNSSSTNNVEPAGYLNAVLNEQVIFQATSVEWGSKPWISNGTVAGTRLLLKDLNFAGPVEFRPEGITATKDLVFFTAYRDGVFQGSHSQLWATDGTAANTILLKDGDSSSGIRLLDKSQNIVLFSDSYSNLWITNGTINGTRALKSSSSSSSNGENASNETTTIRCSPFSGTSDQEPVGGKLYFNCNNEGWVTDGTDQGTFKLLPDKVIRQYGLTGRELTLVNKQFFLLAASFNTQSRESTEQQFVYSTTGTTSNTSTNLLLDLSQDPQIVSLYGAFLPDDDGNSNSVELLFAVDGQLVKTDGTTNGTSSEGLLDFSPDTNEAKHLVLFRVGNRAVIIRTAPDNSGEVNIYSTTNGTEQGTTLLTTLYDTNEINSSEQKHRLVKHHRFSKETDNGPIALIFESPPFANSTTTSTNW
jgi:ELWxxDGT repeat protein